MKTAARPKKSRFRGAVPIQTDPFIFRWTVNEGGYEWLEGKDGKPRLYPRMVPGARIAVYAPEPGLYQEFAAVRSSQEGIRQFVEKYGDLFDRWDIMHTPARGGLLGGTSLEGWKVKIEDMRSLVDIWDQIQEEGRHPELKRIIVRTDKEISYVRGGTNHTLARLGETSRFDPRDTVSYALCALQWEVNRRLADTETPCLVVPQLTWTSDARPHQRITFRPSNLLAEMWLRFAQTIVGEFGLKRCAVCSRYFQVGPGGKRQDTATCSARCRQIKSRTERESSAGKND